MKKTIRDYGLAVAALSALWTSSQTAANAQEFGDAPAAPAAETEESWYRSPAVQKENSVAREKAIARGQQRMARLEAMRWYGFQGGRPTAAAMPFTTMYSPAWQQPGGRPFAWYTSSRPITIYHMSPLYK
ncbi:MAG TPA: hypothetical protein VF175_15575 [Lacipirellula sp.]